MRQTDETNPIQFIDREGTFEITNPQHTSGLYFPLASESGIKSCVTPSLGGDSKLDQNHFILEPVSVENLHNNRSSRNFWIKGKDFMWSATGVSATAQSQMFQKEEDFVKLQGGFLWQKVTRTAKEPSIEATITSYAVRYDDIEVMKVNLKNIGNEALTFQAYAAVPVYGRSADNLRDHRHVTSLLHRIVTREEGVFVTPTLSFDERGHNVNETTYGVCGFDEQGNHPIGFFPTVESFIQEGGTFEHPRAVQKQEMGEKPYKTYDGYEAMGAFSFAKRTLEPKEEQTYYILIGIAQKKEELLDRMEIYGKKDLLEKEEKAVAKHWEEKIKIQYETGDHSFDSYMKWVTLQPELRRLFGCSFLPHHDYGKGGRGWRDLWQDCLALLLMNPKEVRKMLLANFDGVRLDGTNATIIGTNLGEFLADRNHINRVWMDHGMWPLFTVLFYVNQTGDLDFLLENARYFKDAQCQRGDGFDTAYEQESDGIWQKDVKEGIYKGSIIEHLLLENVCAFYDAGEHNYIRLRDADWNDALDMAKERGESVAFSCAYAKNLLDLAELLKQLKECKNVTQLTLLKEAEILFPKEKGNEIYKSIVKKKAILESYTNLCKHKITGETKNFEIEEIRKDLIEKATCLKEEIRKHEWIREKENGGWFNGYYDNHANPLEGIKDGKIKMMLTSQVFAIMSHTALNHQVEQIIQSADRYLYEKDLGGYRLNTDFNEVKTDMGRMFGFAYGEKENGAVFSHMAVMYAYALYERGFAKEGFHVLKTLKEQALHFNRSRIYPGIPEYFNQNGRGLYHYLTGAASWYLFSLTTKSFGIRGDYGDLCIDPKLVAEQFDENGRASISFPFAQKEFAVTFLNSKKKEYKAYKIASIEGRDYKNLYGQIKDNSYVIIKKATLDTLKENQVYEITIVLE